MTMFENASRKLGLDRAVMSGVERGVGKGSLVLSVDMFYMYIYVSFYGLLFLCLHCFYYLQVVM
jgi:hypothetical protein